MKCKILSICVAIILILTCSYTVLAKEFDLDKTGSISVTLVDQKQSEPIVGAELSIYFVATVTMDADGNLVYDYTESFKNLDISIDDTSLLNKLDTFVSQYSVPSLKIITDAQGTAVCKDLVLGLYFVKQTITTSGFSPCTPFLVTVPNKSDDGYVYDVNATPKTETTKLTDITIKKVWNTDQSTKITDTVTIQLLKNGNLIKTATLNQDNNWQVTYENMPEGDDYSVKELNVPKGFTATYKQTGYVFTVTNTSTLIQTGQLIWPIPTLSVSGMLLIALGTVLLKKKRKTNA